MNGRAPRNIAVARFVALGSAGAGKASVVSVLDFLGAFASVTSLAFRAALTGELRG